MECNKDEALRAKSIAEDKLDRKDFIGARKFAMKAKNLFPGLDGLSQMLTTIDVYISAENKINGEVDWYGVLGVDPSVDDEVIKKQYRKLALMLHPDKNKSIGADGAFMLISEAFGMLSDKAKRLAYNQRRGFIVFQYISAMHGGMPSQPQPYPPPVSTGNGVSAKTTSKTPKSQNKSMKPTPPPKPAPNQSFQTTNTFWTICHGCKRVYEYSNIYLNRKLLCHHCNVPFLASSVPPPKNFPKSSKQVPKQRKQRQTKGRNMTAGQRPGDGQENSNFQPGPFPGKMDNSIGAKTVHTLHQAWDKFKRAYTTESCANEESVEKSKLDEHSSRLGVNCNMGMENGGFGRNSCGAGCTVDEVGVRP